VLDYTIWKIWLGKQFIMALLQSHTP